MKKAALALTTLAALTVTTVALAQEPTPGGPTPTMPQGASTPAAPNAPDVPGAPGAQPTPAAPVPLAGPCPAGSTTTLTAADVTATPLPTPPPSRETITVRQTYRPNRPLLYTGTTMLIGSYAATAVVTFTQNIRDNNGDQTMYIPVAGPWMHLANSGQGILDKALIAGSGVAQGAGLVIGVLSLFIPEHVPAATIQAGGVTVNFTATSYGRGSAGVGAVGQF